MDRLNGFSFCLTNTSFPEMKCWVPQMFSLFHHYILTDRNVRTTEDDLFSILNALSTTN